MAPSGHMAMITAGQSSHSPHVADRPGTCKEQAGRPASQQACRQAGRRDEEGREDELGEDEDEQEGGRNQAD